MSRVGIDLDGVLYDFDFAFRSYLIDTHGWRPDWCTAVTRWEFYEDWGISLAGFKRVCHQAADAGRLWNEGPPMDRRTAIPALRGLKEAGHSLHVITHRGFGTHPSASHVATAKWLGEYDIPYDTLTFSGDKTIVKTDWMIEDNADNYSALKKSGCNAVLIDRPWNQHVEDAVRVTSVSEFAELVEGASK